MSAITLPAHVKMCVPTQKALTNALAVAVVNMLQRMAAVQVIHQLLWSLLRLLYTNYRCRRVCHTRTVSAYMS